MVRQTRRQFVTGIAAAGLTLRAVGTVSASGRQRYVVTAPGRSVNRKLEREGFDVAAELADGSVLLVDGPFEAAAGLEGIGGVRSAATDVRLEVDLPPVSAGVGPGETVERAQASEPTLYDLQWDKQVTDALAAHELATGAGTTLAILDTGIDPDHPDLERNVDEDASRLFASGDPIGADDDPWDTDGHGTHVAGIAAAAGEEGARGTGIVGVAPEATLVSAKVFWFEVPEDPDGEQEEPVLMTTTGDILRAVDYAASIGADAANLSLGTAPLPPRANAGGIRTAYQRVIRHAVRRGTVVVASAGNDAANLQQGGYFSLPNSTAGAISVGATGPNDELVFYSNYGTNEVDVAAPGGGYETEAKTLCTEAGIVAGSCEGEGDEGSGADANCTECEPGEWPYPTNLVYSSVPPDVYGEPYAYFAGTSMAAPQVTGLVGLVRELRPDADPNRVEGAIERGAEGRPGRGDPELGAGRIDARGTVERL